MDKKRLSRREFLAAATAASGAALLAACAPAATPEIVEIEKQVVVTQQVKVETVVTAAAPPPQEPVTVSFATWTNPARTKVIDETVSRFEELNPDVKVDFQGNPGTGHREKVLAIVAGGAAPDIYHVWYDMTVLFVEADLAMNLQPFIDASTIVDEDNLPPAIDIARYGGNLYGLPRTGGCFGDLNVYYNRTLFDEAGIPYPEWDIHDPTVGWTFSDLEEIAKALTKDTTGDGKTDQWGVRAPGIFNWIIAIFSNGGDLLKDNNTKCAFDMPETVEALQWLADLRVKHHVSPLPDQIEGLGDIFMAGNCGMLYYPGKYANNLQDAGVEFDWAVADIPRGRAGATNLAVTHPILMATTTPYPDAAWKWMEYTMSDECQRFHAIWTLAFPPQTKSVAQADDYCLHDGPPYDMSPFAYGETRTIPKVREWRQISEEIVVPELDRAFLSGEPVAEIVPTICEKIDKLLEEA